MIVPIGYDIDHACAFGNTRKRNNMVLVSSGTCHSLLGNQRSKYYAADCNEVNFFHTLLMIK